MRPLRIALVHSFYSSAQPSGENEAVREQVRVLRTAGHDVTVVAARTDDLAGRALYPLRAAATVAGGRGPNPAARLRAFAPDVVHVHNLFPNFSRAWVRSWPGPLVATLHNFRPLCASANLYRAGAVCTRCPDGDRWAGLRHGCYRDSRAATAPLAWAGRHGAAGDPVLRHADRLIVLSDLARRMYERAGVPGQRTVLIPNFAAESPTCEDPAPSGRWVVAGRLTQEKGVADLLRRWPDGAPLDVVGDGELMAECRAAAPPSVRFLGSLERDALLRRMPSWLGLVFPSRCLEGSPLIQAEAMAAGLPVLAFEGSPVAESVRAQGSGAVVSWDEPLAPALTEAAERFPALREHCRRVYAEQYAEHTWLGRIEELYTQVIDGRGARPAAAEEVR